MNAAVGRTLELYESELTEIGARGMITGRQVTREREPDFVLNFARVVPDNSTCDAPPTRAVRDRRGLTVYAVIETGGKQYRVAEGDTIEVERVPADEGATVEIDRVLMVAGDTGITIGAPVVDGARVVATVSEHLRGPKITVFKMKAKKRYRRKTGHRQELTRLKIDAIKTA